MKWTFRICCLLLIASCGQQENAEKKADTNHHGHVLPSGGSSAYVKKINSGELKEDTLKGSPKMVAMANVGDAQIHITYNSPGVKNRQIWGGLVPFDQVWVTGAHSATSINVNHDFIIGGKTIPAGTYAFFTIPGREKWVVIVNKNYQQHLTDDYDPSLDLVRVDLVPQAVDFTPRLMYSVTEISPTNGLISVQWEKVKIDLPVAITSSTK
ncbi:DUF2911 domain-containing protein [Pseudoflavitalea rhizosphaerae]|uniref:DUF2911 domain-containing protein n=1 Tax=Pseudoflavitalea rhizosphaerae TaxID=1884793 RepID=UPI000F8C5B1F|nr:DUF2911 domain-containing protein [Pseudoflavitalea rhizosphaerae]